MRLQEENKMQKASYSFPAENINSKKERSNVRHLGGGLECPKVTLWEKKGCFCRGTEKLPFQTLLSGEELTLNFL